MEFDDFATQRACILYNVYTVLYVLTFKEFKNGEKKKIERESKTTG